MTHTIFKGMRWNRWSFSFLSRVISNCRFAARRHCPEGFEGAGQRRRILHIRKDREPKEALSGYQYIPPFPLHEDCPMNETPQEYTERILAYQQGRVPARILASTPRRLSKLLRGVPRKKLRARPGNDRWSIAEILAHLADAEIVTGFRLRLVLGSSGVTIHAFDQDVWAEFSQYRKQDPLLSLNAFQTLRRRNVALLKSIPKERWDNFGMHTLRGKETVARIIEMLAGHDINHLRQIEEILRPGGKRP
jgi:hypothetical protein